MEFVYRRIAGIECVTPGVRKVRIAPTVMERLDCVKAEYETYKGTAPLYEIEDSWDGFEWLAPDDADRNIVSFIRRDKQGNELVALVCFSGSDVTDYRLGVPNRGKYKVVFNSDDKKYGGEGKLTKKTVTAVKKPSHGKPYSFPIAMPKLTCVYLVREPDIPESEKSKKRAVRAAAKPAKDK